ncbi:hypothetical protein NW752_006860 [Fusarium irregulare]|uniref:Uncharacterized protein n=1 Tax=Fusarium irregulare TaxID=2494466 RepID=A0A9W8PR70_9HYPO|nr:hypothetical protein NW766_005739 [Fusarium irregulare]KAJ4015928.1 hypothetical protein NW752_006860 [Fusarium irregulare]
MPPKEKPPRKRLKIIHNTAATPNEHATNEPETNEPETNEPETNEPETNEPETNEPDNVGMGQNSTPAIAKHPGVPPTDADNVDPSVLEDVALSSKVRLKIYDYMVAMESTGIERDHLGRFLCPIDGTGLPPYLTHAITTISGLRQEYLVEVFKRVVLTFTSSESLKVFSQFIRSHFNLDSAQVPCLHIKTSISHHDTFPQGVKFNEYVPVDAAHGMWDKPDEHLRA